MNQLSILSVSADLTSYIAGVGWRLWDIVFHTYAKPPTSKVTVATRGCLIVGDILVLCITWYATHMAVSRSRREAAVGDTPTFAGILLRDGRLSSTPICLHNLKATLRYSDIGATYFL